MSVPKIVVSLLVLLVGSAQAAMTVDEMLQLDHGFNVFTTETFDGNGRTCSTCHIPKESYNIFPATIAGMSDEEKALVFATDVPGLENIDLVTSHALFNISGGADTCPANTPDCFGTPGEEHSGPIFRSTMGIFGLAATMDNDRSGFPGTPLLPAFCSDGVEDKFDQLGWAGDGAPGSIVDDPVCRTHHGIEDLNADGTIRAFANAAISQHSTKSLNRTLGVDFRLATDEELDSLAALQMWLGRRLLTDEENTIQGTVNATEFNLELLSFSDDRVALGRDHYVGPAEFAGGGPGPGGPTGPNPNAGAGCNACHVNGGGMSRIGPPEPGPPFPPVAIPGNINLNTDVELGSDDIGLAVIGVPLPHDEGAANIFGPRVPGFEEAFNIQSVIESSQKRAWFHNHRKTDDFEDALTFYLTADFQDNAAAFTTEQTMRNGNLNGTISFPNGDGVEHLGAFLRTLNAFYNLRDCERLLDEAIDRINAGVSAKLPIDHCRFNLKHVKRILTQSKLPNLHKSVQHGAVNIRGKLEKELKHNDSAEIATYKVKIREMRDSIAQQISP